MTNAEKIASLEAQWETIQERLDASPLAPSFSIDGVSVSSEREMLKNELKWIQEELERLRGPTVVHSVGE